MSKSWNQMSIEEQKQFLWDQEAFRFVLQTARATLPATIDVDAVMPREDSIGTLAYFDRAMSESEFEVALYSLVEIAKAANAPAECWRAIDDAARAMAIDPSLYRS